MELSSPAIGVPRLFTSNVPFTILSYIVLETCRSNSSQHGGKI
jgi:hypothetical protein